jgi:hypothetical protein
MFIGQKFCFHIIWAIGYGQNGENGENGENGKMVKFLRYSNIQICKLDFHFFPYNNNIGYFLVIFGAFWLQTMVFTQFCSSF